MIFWRRIFRSFNSSCFNHQNQQSAFISTGLRNFPALLFPSMFRIHNFLHIFLSNNKYIFTKSQILRFSLSVAAIIFRTVFHFLSLTSFELFHFPPFLLFQFFTFFTNSLSHISEYRTPSETLSFYLCPRFFRLFIYRRFPVQTSP